MFVTPAYAQSGASPFGGFDLIIPFVLILPVLYFFMIRPQQQQLRRRQEMLKAVRRGDTVVTGGGIVGKVHKVLDDNEITLEIAENVRIRVLKSSISEVRARGEPVKEEALTK